MAKFLVPLLGLLLFALLCWLCITSHLPEFMALANPAANTNTASVPAANTNTNTTVLGTPSFRAETRDGKFVVTGVVPDQATKDQLLAKSREVHGADNIVDQVTVDAKVAKPSWLASVLALLPSTAKDVKSGGLSVEGKSISLLGQVPSDKIKTDIGLAAAKAAPDVNINNLLTVGAATMTAEQAKTQIQVNEQLVGKIVEFETNSANLTANGKAVLDELVPIFKGQTATKFEIGGHTDADGNDAQNMGLSRRRADTVHKYLVTQGLANEQFTDKGYGETQPKADNATAEGRQRNRRIEFTVQGGTK